MAGTDVEGVVTDHVETANAKLRVQFNQLVTDLETLRAAFSAVLAKLDLDAGVSDTNYAALHNVAAADLDAAQVNRR